MAGYVQCVMYREKEIFVMATSSLDFTCLGLPVVTHATWNEAQTQCALHLFTDHQHAHRFLARELSGAEQQNFARFMMHCALPEETDEEEGMCCVEGVAALSLTNFLVHLRTDVEKVVLDIEAPDLMGFWEPPGWRVPSEGMILWFHPDDGYRAVIAHGREQAADVIRRLLWLERQHMESLCAKIKQWNAPRTSSRATQEIRGVCAKVLCWASVAAKIRTALRLWQSARLN